MAAIESYDPIPGTAQIGARLRALRKSHRLTQVELANRIGIQQSDLSRIENGEYRVGLDTLFKILRVFELSIGEFFEQIVAHGISIEDLDLIKKYQNLSEEGRREVVDFLEFRLRKEEGPKARRR